MSLRRVEEAALILRRYITESKQGAEDMPCPPTTSWLLSDERQPPNLLRDFLANLGSGKPKEKLSAKSLRFVNSCSQDICFATTNGRWVRDLSFIKSRGVGGIHGGSLQKYMSIRGVKGKKLEKFNCT